MVAKVTGDPARAGPVWHGIADEQAGGVLRIEEIIHGEFDAGFGLGLGDGGGNLIVALSRLDGCGGEEGVAEDGGESHDADDQD